MPSKRTSTKPKVRAAQRSPNARPSGRLHGAAVMGGGGGGNGGTLESFAVSMAKPHTMAIAHLDVTGHAPLDYPSIEPTMPTTINNAADIAQALYCKLYHINKYRRELIRRDGDGQNVTNAYADATNEADECLAKLEAIANATAGVAPYPSAADIQRLRAAMSQLEAAITSSAALTLLIGVAHLVITTIPAHNVN